MSNKSVSFIQLGRNYCEKHQLHIHITGNGHYLDKFKMEMIVYMLLTYDAYEVCKWKYALYVNNTWCMWSIYVQYYHTARNNLLTHENEFDQCQYIFKLSTIGH